MRKLAASIFLGTMLVSEIVLPAQAAFVISHVGSTDPTFEGFTPTSFAAPSAVGPLLNDLGHPAWMITGSAQSSQYAYYSGALTATQRADIASYGFVLTMNARVLRGLAPAYDSTSHVTIADAFVDTGAKRLEIDLGIDVNGDTVVALPTSIDNSGPGGSIQSPGQSFTLIGSGSTYHTYQLIFDPLTQLADLSVDGIVRLQGYGGHTTHVGDLGLVWHAFSGGQGNFNFVQVVSVPEPVTIAMLSIGIAGITLSQRRSQNQETLAGRHVTRTVATSKRVSKEQ